MHLTGLLATISESEEMTLKKHKLPIITINTQRHTTAHVMDLILALTPKHKLWDLQDRYVRKASEIYLNQDLRLSALALSRLFTSPGDKAPVGPHWDTYVLSILVLYKNYCKNTKA